MLTVGDRFVYFETDRDFGVHEVVRVSPSCAVVRPERSERKIIRSVEGEVLADFPAPGRVHSISVNAHVPKLAPGEQLEDVEPSQAIEDPTACGCGDPTCNGCDDCDRDGTPAPGFAQGGALNVPLPADGLLAWLDGPPTEVERVVAGLRAYTRDQLVKTQAVPRDLVDRANAGDARARRQLEPRA